MGQYFKAVNLDRREFVCPWCLGAGAKFWEWLANPQGAILAFLLRMSDESGGGDIDRHYFKTARFHSHRFRKTIPVSLKKSEGKYLRRADSVCGSWVGDRIALVGDYDSGGIYEEAWRFQNITEQLVSEWNRFFVDVPQLHLQFEECLCCKPE